MDVFDKPCYKYQKYGLIFIGQWPYQMTRSGAARRIFILILLISFLQVQGRKIITQRKNIATTLQCAPTFLTMTAVAVKFLIGWIHRKKLKKLLDRIPHEWRMLTSKNEMDILEMYAERGKNLSFIYIGIIYMFLILLLSVQIIPVLITALTPLNVSGYYKYPPHGEYFFDPEKHFHWIVIHMDMTLVFGFTAMVAADIAFITIVLHACGMFGIICYRLEHLFDTDVTDVRQNKMIANVIRYHWRILEYVRLINSCYTYSYVLQFFLGVGILSILLVHMSTIMNSNNKEEIVLFTYYIGGHFLIIFLDIVPGQMLLDSKAKMYEKVFDNKWYHASAKSSRMLIHILQICMRPGGINAANIFISSYEIFATIVQSAVSYFMVLYSMQ